MTELLPTLLNRPPIITINGWTEFISIHDRAFLEEKKRLRGLMILAHPDKGGTSKKFIRAKLTLSFYLLNERKYYWSRGLMPPDWKGPAGPPPTYKSTHFLSLEDSNRLLKEGLCEANPTNN